MADSLNPPLELHQETSLAPLNVASGSSTPPGSSLPQLPYSLREHKRSIAIIWTLLALDAAIMPLALFYPLWYASDLKSAYIFAVTTGVFGIISGLEWAYRSWQLWKKEEVRPFGGKRNGVSATFSVPGLVDLGPDGCYSSTSSTLATPSVTLSA